MSMSVRGLASGLDVDSIIEQLIALERKPITLMQQKQKRVEAQQGAWRDVNTRLKNLSDKITALKLASTYTAKATTVGDEKMIKASASSGAVAASYDIAVSELATVSSAYSGVVSKGATEAMQAKGTITIAIPPGSSDADKQWEIAVDPQDSLTKLVEKINKLAEAKDGSKKAIPATASIINNQLVLTAKSSGEAGRFSLTMSTEPGDNLDATFGIMTIKDGIDAKLTINNIEVRSSSNTVSAIPGVSLTLQSKGTTTLSVATDTSVTVKAVQELVDQYNSTMEFINTKLEKEKGDLRGDSTLIGLQSSIRRLLSSQASYTSGKYVTMADIGVSTGKWDKNAPDYSGKLTLDTAKLEVALKADPMVVKNILYTETNVASSSEGATVSGSSYDPALFPLGSVIDGNTDSTLWGMGQGWNSQNPVSTASPGKLTINFANLKTLEKVKLFTLNSTAFPAASYGVKDFDLYYYDENYQRKKIGSVTGNTLGENTQFPNSAKARGIEFEFTASNDSSYARVMEVEAYENSGVTYNLEQYLESFIRSGDGILAEKQKSYTGQIDDIKDQIERMEDRLVQRQETLVRQYTALEKALGSMQNQSNWLTSQIGSLPTYNSGE